MKNLVTAFFPVLMATPVLAAGGVDELVGKYTLKQSVFGNCYPEIRAEKERFGSPEHDSLGIYGRPGAGEIVYQFESINKGTQWDPQTNPMTGEVYGWMKKRSEIGGGKIKAFSEVTGHGDTLYFRRTIEGRFADGTLVFEVTDVHQYPPPARNEKASCIYVKVN